MSPPIVQKYLITLRRMQLLRFVVYTLTMILPTFPLSYQVWITEYLCWTRNDLLGMLAFPNLDYINFLIRESQTKLHQALSYICNYKPDLLIVYNGRLIASRAWIVAADIMGLKYICHERGALDGSFRLYPFSDCGDRF